MTINTHSPGRKTSRQRTEDKALALLKGIRFPRGDRDRVERKIRAAKSPRTLALEVLEIQTRKAARRAYERGTDKAPKVKAAEAPVDHSDTQELMARLIRRDGYIDTVFMGLLTKLDKEIAEGMSRPEFDEHAAMIWAVKSALSATTRKQALDQRARPHAVLPLPVPPVVVEDDDPPDDDDD